jgi:hypothetical protein
MLPPARVALIPDPGHWPLQCVGCYSMFSGKSKVDAPTTASQELLAPAGHPSFGPYVYLIAQEQKLPSPVDRGIYELLRLSQLELM